MVFSDDQARELQQIVKEAGAILMQYYKTSLIRTHKNDGSFATQADLASERFLIEKLQRLLPGAGFYAEESGVVKGQTDYMWVIDPLDGTSNFAHGLPYFCVSVALTFKDVPFVGVIFQPVMNELFFAQTGKGAFLAEGLLAVSAKTDFKQAFASVESILAQKCIGNVSLQMSSIRSCGASALDMAYVAAGIFDVAFITKFSWWDVAAGMVLVQEAGGCVRTFKGELFGYGSESLVAGNNFLVDFGVELIKDSNLI